MHHRRGEGKPLLYADLAFWQVRIILKGGDIFCSHLLALCHTFEEVRIDSPLIDHFLDDILYDKAIFECMAEDAMVMAEIWFIEL
jgi:hypothetical protein